MAPPPDKFDGYALAQQDIHVLEEMIEAKPSLCTTKDDSDRYLLHWAALGGRDSLLELLFSRSDAQNVDTVDDMRATPLILATLKGSLSCVKLLITRGANVNARNLQGHSALQYACSKGHKEIVEFLLENGADVNIQDNLGDTPVHRLASVGYEEILKMILDFQVDLDAQNKQGETALHIACEDNQVALAMMLVGKGARVDIENKGKMTALDVAQPGLRRQIKTKLGILE